MRPCFVDMDGVLADFNGGILKRHNRPDPYLEPANWVWWKWQLRRVLRLTGAALRGIINHDLAQI